ncbi:MAG: penicillin-binding protein 2 [Burkholderiaceae bacterium]|jgi:penicillin-binding protein 2
MTEFRHPQYALRQFRFRLAVAVSFVLICFLCLVARFAWLQVVRYSKYHAQAEDNRISVIPIVPNRGLILDRNGVLLANNYSAYTLEITASKVSDLDQTIDELSTIVDIQARDRKRFKKLLEEAKNFESLPIRTRLTDEEVARFSARRYHFPGVEVKARLFRQYPQNMTAAHVIGYIGRVSQKDVERLDESNDADNYRGTHYVGKEGIEKSYERILHGQTGFEEVETSAGGRAVRTLSQSNPTPGDNLILSLDIRLQQVAEHAFGNKRGALVAIEPSTGDVLAWVSMPAYDPNLFVEGIDADNWKLLNESPDRPLINRPLSGTYPPGSTFKPFMALAALEMNKRSPGQAIMDPGYFMFGGHKFRDDKEGGHGYVNMYTSIVHSCDTYYYMLANDLGIDNIASFMQPFGFGRLTGIDLVGERRGVLPSTAWKRKAYKRPELKRWYAGETVSVAIGQGYNSYTPLQLAHATAVLANGGVVMKPHLVKTVEDSVSGRRTLTVARESNRIPLNPRNIDIIRRAMIGVNQEGTSAKVFAGAEYISAGKTGTAQVYTMKQNEKYDEKRVHERLRDHALFISFAPADAPKIALAVLVENGGFGAQAAAPIARTVLDYYLLGRVPEALKPGFANPTEDTAQNEEPRP